MEFGCQLRRLRISRNIEISDFAQQLGIAPEQIENWENELELPDIYLLPRIAVAFGVAIDDLYTFSDDESMDRICNAISDSRELSDFAFRRHLDFLESKRARDPMNTQVRIMCAQLYGHRIRSDRRSMELYAKEVLEISPDDQIAWSALIYAMEGKQGDQWLDDKKELLEYLRDYLKTNPGNRRATHLLATNLIAEGLADEASGYVNDFALFPGSEYLIPLYTGDIALIRGDRRTALIEWENAVRFYPLSWKAHSEFALRLNRLGLYNRALKEYDRAYVLQSTPRSVEPLMSRAVILEKNGLLDEAVEEHRRILRELETNFGVTSGEKVNGHLREIARIASLSAFR